MSSVEKITVEQMVATQHLKQRDAALVLGISQPSVYRLRAKLGMSSPGRTPQKVPASWFETIEEARREAQRREYIANKGLGWV